MERRHLNHQLLREEVVRVSRRMSESGLVMGTSGNVSARTPDGNVLVNLEGVVVEGSFEPSVETPMHTGIYRARPETGGIVHTHARYSTTLACLNWELPPIHYMLAVLSDEGRVPLARYATYGTGKLARNAAEALGSSHAACLLSNHGTIAVGGTVSEAYSRTELLEEMAEVSAKIHDYGQHKPSPSRTE